MDEIRFVQQGHVGTLSLNRPDKLNAQTPAMWLRMAELGKELVQLEDLRVLIVDGPGRSFSAGIDISAFIGGGTNNANDAGASGAEGGTGAMNSADAIGTLQAGFSWLEEAPFLTVAKVQGHALGAGMQLALACDIRIVGDDCSMGLLETRWGLMPDLGGTVWLPRLIGPARALEFMVTAQRLNAAELLALGIVNRVVSRDELDATVDAFAAQIVAQPPIAVRGAKAAVRRGWGNDTATGMRAAAEVQLDCLRSADFREAGMAYVEGRTPNFTGR